VAYLNITSYDSFEADNSASIFL